MSDYRLADLLDLTIIQKMADAHYRAAGMPIGIIDAIDGSVLVGSGWQDICIKFHRTNHLSLQRCQESDNYIKDRLVQGEACHYKCKNGLLDIGVPIVVAGRHLATLFLGQFFYEGEAPDREFFARQAHEFDFQRDDYLAALDRVPVFSREKVDYILEYDKALVDFIADLGEHALFKIKADEKIRESEQKFHTVFDQAYQFIGLLSIDGSMLETNRTALAFGGVEEKDVIGRPFWQTPWWVHSPELQRKIRLAVQEAAQGALVQFETSHPAADGNLHYVDFSLKPVKDKAGRVIMLMAEGRDITERKLAAEEIKRQAEFLQILIDAMPYPVFYKDRQCRYLGCNGAFERFYGISREQIAGKTVHEIASKELADVYHQADEALFAHPGMQIYEGSIQSTHGLQHDVIFHKATFNGPDGAIAGLIGAVVDITERKEVEKALQESEAKMRSILDNIGIGVALISPEMKILELNLRMHQWFPDIDPGQRPICYQAYNDPPREEMCEYCPTGKTLQDGLVHEATTQTPQAGAIRNYRIVSTPILNQSGEVTAAIEMVEDITDKLSLQSQLHQAQKMESVGRLAGGVAHDFNNMLGVIIGHTEMALDQMNRNQPLFESLQEILQAALRSADLTRQLLAFARKQIVTPKVLDLNETVEAMLKMLRRLIGEDINIVWLPDSDLWLVKMDPSQIDQILANLCVNARDAIAEGGKVTIETQTVTFDEAYCADHSGVIPGDFVMLAVSDNGQGMDRETLDNIFEPFFTTKGIGEGTGLGLATVYGVVKQNNGFINVYSEPGHGSTFKIYLPRHAAKGEDTRKEGLVTPDAQGHDETILLVEDDPSILRMTRLMLENLGYRVLAASTPSEAISLARKHAGETHLLLTDVVMPEMNGRDLAQELISLYPGLRSLFMSGYTGNVIAHHGVLGNGVNFIQKPFLKQALAAKVREVLDSK
ncbi:MAG: PocR ligand-binding domain-containing protein [Proteobacteria bacterium]|nr:PocR ligand-binding domain-containing protein [Pseudomonadota bacterium]